MAINNIDRVGQGLDVLSGALLPFIERILGPKVPSGAEWPDLLAAKDDRPGRTYEATDPHIQLRVITERLGSLHYPFNEVLSRGEQNLAGELREVRNRFAHRSKFSADDTYRALDTTERLLRAIGAIAEADSVRKMKVDAQRAAYAEETRRDVRSSTSSMPDLADAELTPWREILTPHPDIAAGDFARAEFAADLHRVAAGEGAPEYVDPVRFFDRTYLTEGLKTLLRMTARRISGDPNAQSVINLQTTFGGGKTHSMLAAWHLLGGRPINDFPQGVQDLLGQDDLGSTEVKRVAIVGNELAPGQPTTKPDGTTVNTLWGELAWQLDGSDGYALVAEADRTGTNPGEALRTLIERNAPALILIDEWVAYARGLYGRDDLVGGSFDTQFTFAQHLTEVVKSVPGALLLVSIPASDVRFDETDSRASDLEIGGTNGWQAMQRLKHVVSRVAQNWTPASSGESFEIVRRRLFVEPDADGMRKINATVRRFADYYRSQAGELPSETRQVEYEGRMRTAFPIHPELFDRLYGDWSGLERFQRTRGVLRLMSAVVHSLYRTGDDSPMILPGSVPLDDPAVRDEVTSYLDDAWRSIIETDIDGENATPLRVDRERPLFGKRALTRRIARSLFLGSAATLASGHKGIERQRLFLGVAMPGDTLGNFGSALQMLTDRGTYIYSDGNRHWYDRQPSLNRMVTERALSLEIEDVYARAVTLLKGATGKAPEFGGEIIAPASTADVPEAEYTRLIVLHPRHTLTGKSDGGSGWAFVDELMRSRGSAARQNANTVIVVGADEARWADVEEALRINLAWTEICSSVRELDLTQSQVDQARRRESETQAVVDQRLAAAWIWAVHPVQVGGRPYTLAVIKVDGGERRIAVRAGERLGKQDVIDTETSPVSIGITLDQHLRSRWNRGHIALGELWQYHVQYPYMPRLRDKSVLLRAVASVMSELAWTQRGFALADDYDDATGDYIGLRVPLEVDDPGVIDDQTLLVAPRLAQDQFERDRASEPDTEGAPADDTGSTAEDLGAGAPPGVRPPIDRPRVANARFDGDVDLKPRDDLRTQVVTLVDELLIHLQDADPDTFEIRVSVSADKSDGFDANTVRTVGENARNLGLSPGRFTEL